MIRQSVITVLEKYSNYITISYSYIAFGFISYSIYINFVNLDEDNGDGQDGCYPMASAQTEGRHKSDKHSLTPASKHQSEPSSKRLHVATKEQEQGTGM